MKTVNIANLKKNLSGIIKEVQNGCNITINNRNIPVAYIIPITKKPIIIIQEPKKKESLSKIKFNIPKIKIDTLAILLEERGQR